MRLATEYVIEVDPGVYVKEYNQYEVGYTAKIENALAWVSDLEAFNVIKFTKLLGRAYIKEK